MSRPDARGEPAPSRCIPGLDQDRDALSRELWSTEWTRRQEAHQEDVSPDLIDDAPVLSQLQPSTKSMTAVGPNADHLAWRAPDSNRVQRRRPVATAAPAGQRCPEGAAVATGRRLWVGSTRAVTGPGLPQIRTCATSASGSLARGLSLGDGSILRDDPCWWERVALLE